jgi:toxin ParE1/3/4
MSGYRLRPSAERDMDAIWAYTFRTWSAEQADSYIDQLFDAFQQLAEIPGLGQEAFVIGCDFRRFRVGHHLIFYKAIEDSEVDVIRILHEKSDFPRHLGIV